MAQLTLVLLLLLEVSVVCFLASASVLEDNKAARTTCGLRPVDVTEALKRQPAFWLLDRIVGGKPAKYGQYPWQARISFQQGGYHLCAGIIIDEYWILSAAHCFSGNIKRAGLVVHVGDLNTTKPDEHEQRIPVEKVIPHEKYSDLTTDYDIALLKVKPVKGKGIQFNDYVQPACLPEADTPYTDEKMCLISGWGSTNESSQELSKLLRGAEVPLVNDELCSELYSDAPHPVTPRMVCAGFMEGKVDACQGDSGGPLVCKEKRGYTVMGVVSWGDGCARPARPGVYARVSKFLSWIAQKMRQ